jgi:hypothetical protein
VPAWNACDDDGELTMNGRAVKGVRNLIMRAVKGVRNLIMTNQHRFDRYKTWEDLTGPPRAAMFIMPESRQCADDNFQVGRRFRGIMEILIP